MSTTSHVGAHQCNDYDVKVNDRDAERVNNANCVATVTNDMRHHGNAELCSNSNITIVDAAPMDCRPKSCVDLAWQCLALVCTRISLAPAHRLLTQPSNMPQQQTS